MSKSFHAAATGPNLPRASDRRAFTLVELLVAMTVLLILILTMVGLTNQANGIWRTSRERITAFQGARTAFERITANLSQATLNTYLDYYNASGQTRADVAKASGGMNGSGVANFVPATYDRASELQFLCGSSMQTSAEPANEPALIPPPGNAATRPTHCLFFQCPIGNVSDPNQSANSYRNLTRSLNAVGYYVEFANESDPQLNLVPKFITKPAPPASWRYRLMEMNQPSQNLTIYTNDFTNLTNPWYSAAVNPAVLPGPVYSIADNVVALVVRPKSANPTASQPQVSEIAPNYAYDTKAYSRTGANGNTYAKIAKNQLPPLVQVTLVAIDADSAARLANQFQSSPPPLVANTLFTNATIYNTDMDPSNRDSLLYKLQSLHLNYRVFVTDVSIPGAKWSQTN